MRMLSVLFAALVLAGCSDSAKDIKGEKGDPWPDIQGSCPAGFIRIVREQRGHDQRVLHRHVQHLPAGPSGKWCPLW